MCHKILNNVKAYCFIFYDYVYNKINILNISTQEIINTKSEENKKWINLYRK
jgi:hypothetical protein